MLGSDSGSSDLSEVDASSSSSEEDMTLDHRIPSNTPTNAQHATQRRTTANIPPNLTPPKKRLPQSSALYRAGLAFSSSPVPAATSATSGKKNYSKNYTSQVGASASMASSLSSSGSDSDSLGSDLSDSDGGPSLPAAGSQKSRGKRPPAKSKPSSKLGPDPVAARGAPISLTDSQPVYAQEVMDGTLMPSPFSRLPRNTSQPKSSKGHSTVSSRGSGGKKGGRGGRSLLGGGSTKVKSPAAGDTVIIDFDKEDLDADDGSLYVSLGSNSPALVPPILAPAGSTAFSPATKSAKKAKASSKPKEKKAKAKKGRHPASKHVDQEVYCICRGTYDGSEFMIACDRCEEWFHGRCIGVKPQAAKKTTHFYCQDCLTAMRQPPPPSTSSLEKSKKKSKSKEKSKDKSKKSKKKKKSKDDDDNDPWAMSKHEPAPSKHTLAQEEEEVAVAIESSDDDTLLSTSHPVTPTTNPSLTHDQRQPNSFQRLHLSDNSPLDWESQQHRPHATSSTKILTADTPTLAPKPALESSMQDTHYYAPPTAPPAARFAPAPPSMDEDDEDVCPVCEFECTCGPQAPMEASPQPLPTPSRMISAKAPMPTPQQSSLCPPEQGSVSVGLSFQESPAESFQSAFKSPMAPPSGISHRRPSVSRMSGKGLGKAPVLMKAVKSQAYKSSHGKTFKSGKAMQYYRHLLSSSESEDGESDAGSDDDMEDGNRAYFKKLGRQDILTDDYSIAAAVDEEDEEEEESGDDVDDVLSIESSSSLSDQEDGTSTGDNPLHLKASSVNSTKGSKWIAKNVEMNQVTAAKPGFLGVNATSPPTLPSKRGSGRSKKHKDSLGLTPEDENHLYTPAAASSRHLKNSHLIKTNARSPSKKANRTLRESISEYPNFTPVPSGRLDRSNSLGVVGGAIKNEEEEEEDAISSDDDIFGDGELSDAPSDDYFDGELSDDIEAFDDFDDEEANQLFETSDDLESTSSGPHEYHYSDLEEEDEESLVDSDSSLNASSHTDSDNGSETSTDSEIEPPQPIESPEDEIVADEDELAEEELLRLAEEERRIVQRAHLLQEYLSEEEEADPDRNPFESSEEEEDSSVDEYEFDADGEGYEDDFYDDDEEDYFDNELSHLNLVYNEYKGSKLEMQALMMIPPEQQEQLLLLQHYAEQQHQKLQQQQQCNDQEQNRILAFDTHTQLPPIPRAQDTTFLMTVPDLDAVSEQLAQSLATSMASSLAGSMSETSPPEDASALTTPLPSSVSPTPTLSTLAQAASATRENVPSMISTSGSVQQNLAVSSPGITTPTSATSASTIMPTPANTPTPPLGNDILTKEDEDVSSTPILSAGEETAYAAQEISLESSTQSKVTATNLAATTPASTMSSQEFLESLDAHSAQFLVKTLDSSSQELFSHEKNAREASQDLTASLLSTVFHKRKNEQLGGKDVDKESKRRRTSLSAAVVESGLMPEIEALMGIRTDMVNLVSTPKTPTTDETHAALTNLLTSTSAAELTPSLISLVTSAKLSPNHLHGRMGSLRLPKGRRFSKSEHQDPAATAEEPMPMDDLLDTSALYGEHGEEDENTGAPQAVSKDLSRWEKVPIGTFRRSRRPSSPYIGLQGAIKSGRQDIESALLSATHTQHQEPAVRQSGSHLSSSSGSTRDALRRGIRGLGARRYRSNPGSLSGSLSGTDLQMIMQQALKAGDGASMAGRGKSRPIHHVRSASQTPSAGVVAGAPSVQEALLALMSNTPPSVHAGMLMEELTSLGSPKDLSTPVNPQTIGLARSAATNERSQDSRYHSLSAGGGSSRRRRMTRSFSQHSVGSFRAQNAPPSSSSSGRRGRHSQDGIVSGLGIGAVETGPSSTTSSKDRSEQNGASRAEDVMTDLSQLPSSACPTPLHSPLFSATGGSGSTGSMKDVAIPPLHLDQIDFSKISSSSSSTNATSTASAVQISLRRSTEEEEEEIDIVDETDVDAIWQATFGPPGQNTGKT